MTEQGLFPTIATENILKFLTKNPQKKTIKRKHHFICYVRGLPEAPYYQLYLINRAGKNNLPELFSENNTFLSQGIVTSRSRERVILRVQKNLFPVELAKKSKIRLTTWKLKTVLAKLELLSFGHFVAISRMDFYTANLVNC